MRHHIVSIVASAPVLLSLALAGTPREVELSALATTPDTYEGAIVRTCGWARNNFEETWISIAQSAWGIDGTVNLGLEVDWPESARRTKRGSSEWRCIVGRIENSCPKPQNPDPAITEWVCISTGSPYKWKIVPTS